MTDSDAQTDPLSSVSLAIKQVFYRKWNESVSGVVPLDTLESLLELIGYPLVVDWTDVDLLASD